MPANLRRRRHFSWWQTLYVSAWFLRYYLTISSASRCASILSQSWRYSPWQEVATMTVLALATSSLSDLYHAAWCRFYSIDTGAMESIVLLTWFLAPLSLLIFSVLRYRASKHRVLFTSSSPINSNERPFGGQSQNLSFRICTDCLRFEFITIRMVAS